MRTKETRVRVLLLCSTAFCTSLLTACYFPRQAAFERAVHRQIQIDLPVATAQERLQKLKLTCQMQGSELHCDRIIDRLPMTCIQRVALMISQPQGLVTDIDIPPIACFGGFG